MLECKECGFQAKKDLIPHIEKDHGLEEYLTKHNPSETDLITDTEGPTPVETKPEPVTKSPIKKTAPKVSGDTVSIAGVEVKIQKTVSDAEKSLVPISNPAYHFPKFTDDLAKDINENRRVLLTGHTGCGKTSLICEIASQVSQPVLRINLNGQTTIGDFVGLWTVKGGETIWVDGALPLAMRNGYWLIIDEIDFGEAPILSVLQSVLERNGELTLKEKGHEIVKPHKDFRIFSTANTAGCMSDFRGLYQGTNILNEAFLDRWNVYHVDYLPPEIEAKVICKTVPKMTMTLTSPIVKLVNLVREAFKKEEIQCTFSLRRAIDWAEMIVRHREPLKAAENTIFSKVSVDDAEVIKGLIIRCMKGNKKDGK